MLSLSKDKIKIIKKASTNELCSKVLEYFDNINEKDYSIIKHIILSKITETNIFEAFKILNVLSLKEVEVLLYKIKNPLVYLNLYKDYHEKIKDSKILKDKHRYINFLKQCMLLMHNTNTDFKKYNLDKIILEDILKHRIINLSDIDQTTLFWYMHKPKHIDIILKYIDKTNLNSIQQKIYLDSRKIRI
jgi:hypothetical protein